MKRYPKNPVNPVKKNPIRPDQIRFIKTAISVLKMPNSNYYDMLWHQFQVVSCKDLTYLQAEKLKAHLKKLGFKPKKRGKQTKKQSNTGQVSFFQARKIRGLLIDLNWTNENRRTFCLKYFQSSYPQSSAQASKLILQLKAIIAKDRPEPGAPGRA